MSCTRKESRARSAYPIPSIYLPHRDLTGFRRDILNIGLVGRRVGLDLAEIAGRLAGRFLGELALGDSHELGARPPGGSRSSRRTRLRGRPPWGRGQGGGAGTDEVGAEPEALDEVRVGREPVEDAVEERPSGASSVDFAFKASRVAMAAIARSARVATTAALARSPLKEGPAKVWDAA
jgi:hypothetical protein